MGRAAMHEKRRERWYHDRVRLVRAASFLSVSVTASCGLFFGDASEGTGVGAAAGAGPAGSTVSVGAAGSTSATTGTGGEGVGGQAPFCTLLRACEEGGGGAGGAAPGEPWSFTYAAAELVDLVEGPGVIHFAGSARAGAEGGLLEHLPVGVRHYYVASVKETGCDLVVCDLGSDPMGDNDISLSRGDPGHVYVAWKQSARLCTALAGDPEAPSTDGLDCGGNEDLSCAVQGGFSQPFVGYDATTDDRVVSFKTTGRGAVLQCAPSSQRQVLGGPTTYVWSSATGMALPVGDSVEHVQVAPLPNGGFRLGGHCLGGEVGGTPCAPPSGFNVFTALLTTSPGTVTSASILLGGADQVDPAMTIHPTARGFATTLQGPGTARSLLWQDASNPLVGGSVAMADGAAVFHSAEDTPAPGVGEPIFVASGSSRLSFPGVPCPDASCTHEFAFFALLYDDLMDGLAFGVFGPDTNKAARARGAFQLADGDVALGGDYYQGEIDGLPGAETPVTATNMQRALFVARVNPP